MTHRDADWLCTKLARVAQRIRCDHRLTMTGAYIIRRDGAGYGARVTLRNGHAIVLYPDRSVRAATAVPGDDGTTLHDRARFIGLGWRDRLVKVTTRELEARASLAPPERLTAQAQRR